jgi:flagellar motor switch protein FliG
MAKKEARPAERGFTPAARGSVPESSPAPGQGTMSPRAAATAGRKAGKPGPKKQLTGRQKAAVFIISLGHEIAAEIFKHLRDDEIEQLTFEIARNEAIDPADRDQVLMEFQELMMAQDFISTGGIEYARELLERSVGSQKAVDIINRLTSSLQVRPFDFIRRTDPAHLLNFIQQEHPQTIALILAYLEPNKASAILGSLPTEVQSDVAKRIATMDRTSPEVLREVERVLEKKLSTLSSEDYTAAGGVESIVEILNLVDRSTEKGIIERLEEDDPELAEDIKKRMFVFEDIVLLDDRAIQKVLREVDTTELAKALKAVDSEVQDKIFRNMSKRAATLLKEDMDYMGPVRLKDVEESQQRIVTIIRKLEEQGEIVVARAGEDELVV